MEMTAINWEHKSLMTAIKTPYQEDGSIDFDTYDKLVQRQIEAKVDALVVCGTTGEGHLMDWKENLSLILHTLKNFGKQIGVIGNTGSNFTKEAVRATKEAINHGVPACLHVNPYYGKTSNAGLIKHFSLVLDIAPCFIYNVPSRTAQDLEPVIIAEIAKHPNFLGVKECSGLDRIEKYEKQGIACWTGNDHECYEVKHKIGGHGLISVAANIIPEYFRRLIDNPDEALFAKCLPLIETLFCEPNPIAVNSLLAMMGLCKPVFRLPYMPLPVEKQEQLIKDLQKIDASKEAQVIAPSKFRLIY